MIEEIYVTQELTAKAAENYDRSIADLWNTCALSLWEIEDGNIDQNPVLASDWTVISFDRVAVLLSWICDTTENVNKPVSQCAGGMVVSAAVQAWDIKPNIKIDVILLARPVGIFGVESGAGDNQKFIL